jgi:hypothetical protein
MRVLSGIGLALPLGLAGLVFAGGSSPAAPAPPAIPESIPKSVFPPPPRQEGTSATPVTAGLVCIQNALGGFRAFAGVSSFRIIGSTKPTAPPTGPHPLASRREIRVVFPDRISSRTGC